MHKEFATLALEPLSKNRGAQGIFGRLFRKRRLEQNGSSACSGEILVRFIKNKAVP